MMMYDTVEAIQARVPKLKGLTEKEPYDYNGLNDKLWQERMAGKQLRCYKLEFDRQDNNDGFDITVNAETGQIEHISIFLWGSGLIKDREIVNALVGDKYEIDHQRGGHGSYGLMLKRKD